MASYYYPYGFTPNVTSVDYALTASVATAASASNIPVASASFASLVVTPPPAGAAGTNKLASECTLPAPQGPKGPKGPAGAIAGTNLTVCPPDSIECVGLTPPAGFSKVCIQIPFGCDPSSVICPPTLDGFAPPYNPTTTTTTTTSGVCTLLGETFLTATTAPAEEDRTTCTTLNYPTTGQTLYGSCASIEAGCTIYTDPFCASTAVASGISAFTDGTNSYVLNGSSAIDGSLTEVCIVE